MKQLLPVLLLSLALPVFAQDEGTVPAAEIFEDSLEFLQTTRAVKPETISRDLSVYQLRDGVWLHRSYYELGDQRLHANGLIVVSDADITVIDSPWTPSAAQDLIGWLESKFEKPLKRLVITHAHEDRMGGIDTFMEHRVTVYGQSNTALLARQRGWTAPNITFDGEMLLRTGDEALELYFPGPAHAPDNIVVWIPQANVLFAGDMVKSRYTNALGFTGDADKSAWPGALERIRARYPQASVVVPAHGLPGDTGLFDHTASLIRN